MTDNEIIQEATEAVEKGLPSAFLVKPLLDVVKEQKSEIAKKDTEIDILMRKKKTLRDEVAEQQAEIERLKCSAIRNGKQIGSLIHHLETAKSEAYRDFAERLCKDRVSNDPVVIAAKVELEELTESNE